MLHQSLRSWRLKKTTKGGKNDKEMESDVSIQWDSQFLSCTLGKNLNVAGESKPTRKCPQVMNKVGVLYEIESMYVVDMCVEHDSCYKYVRCGNYGDWQRTSTVRHTEVSLPTNINCIILTEVQQAVKVNLMRQSEKMQPRKTPFIIANDCFEIKMIQSCKF